MKTVNIINPIRDSLKHLALASALGVATFMGLAPQAQAAPIIWDGPTITFTKADNADWLLEANQDRITPNVWITRQNKQQIYNIKIEAAPGGWETDSPKDTEWAWPGQFGNSSDPAQFKAANYASLHFGHFDLVAGGAVAAIVGIPAVVHLISDNIYLEVKFTSWTQGAGGGTGNNGTPNGGGFSYTRSTLRPPITYDFARIGPSPGDPVASMQKWTQLFPIAGNLWSEDFGWPADTGSLGHLGAGWNDSETQMGRSPQFVLNGSGDLTFQLFGSKSSLAAVDVTPSTVPATAIDLGGFCGVALRDVATDTYLMSKGLSAHTYDAFATLSFTAEELLPHVIPGASYTLDWIDYDKDISSGNGDGWGWLVNVSIPGNSLSSDCDMLTFGPGAVITGTDIVLTVAPGTTPEQVAAIAPTFTLSPYASCDRTSGSIPSPDPLSTTTAVHYIVTAANGTTTKDYSVLVVVADPLVPPTPPPVIAGMRVWLTADNVDPYDGAQVRVATGGTFIKQWNDLSGNANHATQTTEADQPRYIASGVGGKPVLRFAASSNDAGPKLKLGDLSAQFTKVPASDSAGSMFAVSTINGDGRYNLFDNRDNDSRWVADSWSESQPGVFRGGRTGFDSNKYSLWPQSGSHIFAMESSSSAYTFVIDGTQIGTTGGNYHSGAGQNWTIGDRPGNGQQLKGDIAELILFDRVLTTDEANMMGAYLTAKYGLTNAYPPMLAPAVPTGVVAAPVSSGTIRLTWPPRVGCLNLQRLAQEHRDQRRAGGHRCDLAIHHQRLDQWHPL
ncbi:MAG: hypothetical protein NTW21_09310 [Verrucomicrobia bacterium]|nr:hypothetical protein [Verrucomicrobiota bacterium]